MIAIQRYMTKIDSSYETACLFICLCEIVARETFGDKEDFNDSVVTPEDLEAIRSRCVAKGCLSRSDFTVLDNNACLRVASGYFARFLVSNFSGDRRSLYQVLKMKYTFEHFVLTRADNLFDPLGVSNTAAKGNIIERRGYFVSKIK